MLMSVSRTVDLDDTLSESALTSMLLGGKRLTMPFRHTVVGSSGTPRLIFRS